jgi:hypothetical protein
MIDFFLQRATALPGIERIALVGSITTPKPDPKDLDLLVTVRHDLPLADLARLSRQVRGRLQSINHGCDAFLADPVAGYIGRLCVWTRCGPGIRVSCDARHCGRRKFLHDDFDDIRLADELVRQPPVELWPKLIVRCPLPADLARLVERLDRSAADAQPPPHTSGDSPAASRPMPG